jgi:unsaturated rhamnogalacturonyl hydrolase
VAAANPEAAELMFPPQGDAYVEHAESHVLWRFAGLGAFDFVLVAGADGGGLATALTSEVVAGVGSIPALRVEPALDMLSAVPSDLPASAAREEIERRRARSPIELARLLAPIYGQSFDPPIYISGMGLMAHLRLGNLAHVERLAAPYVDGGRDSFDGRRFGLALYLAGHLVFAALAERTANPAYLERVRAAADFAFDAHGNPLEAMPEHGEMSDSIFMGGAILAAAGGLTGERRYFDMAARHIEFMNALLVRDDGLYRHSPLTDAAWARGNGFASIGYALTLSAFAPDHPARDQLLAEYRSLMETLAGFQNEDGTWRQVVDHPGAYHETSATAIIGFSMQRGLVNGWLEREAFAPVVRRAWQAVAARTGEDGSFIDVSESTNKQSSLRDYLLRRALHGRDERTGGMVMMFALELTETG